MDLRDEKATVDVEQTDASKLSILADPSANKSSETDSAEARKSVHQMSDKQYLHGFKLMLLAVASIGAVFLIA